MKKKIWNIYVVISFTFVFFLPVLACHVTQNVPKQAVLSQNIDGLSYFFFNYIICRKILQTKGLQHFFFNFVLFSSCYLGIVYHEMTCVKSVFPLGLLLSDPKFSQGDCKTDLLSIHADTMLNYCERGCKRFNNQFFKKYVKIKHFISFSLFFAIIFLFNLSLDVFQHFIY